MFERKCYEKLVKWKDRSNGRTALLVEGVRRVGKTLGTVVNTVGVLEDGTVNVNADTYGKGVLVKMTVADRLILDELLDQMAKL